MECGPEVDATRADMRAPKPALVWRHNTLTCSHAAAGSRYSRGGVVVLKNSDTMPECLNAGNF